MSPRFFSFLLTWGTVFAWVSWALVFFKMDPAQSGALGIFLFYISLFLATAGALFFIGTFLRTKFLGRQTVTDRVESALRQALLFAVLIMGLLVLNAQHVATLWNLLLLILILTVLEFFFISRRKHRRPTITYERAD